MKKTYFAPELESFKISTATMLALSTKNEEASQNNNPTGNLSKGFSGSLWDDGDAEEN